MRAKRVVTLGYPAALLPDDLREAIGGAEIVNVLVQEEVEPALGSDIEWETIAKRWVDGELVPIPELEIPPSLLEGVR